MRSSAKAMALYMRGVTAVRARRAKVAQRAFTKVASAVEERPGHYEDGDTLAVLVCSWHELPMLPVTSKRPLTNMATCQCIRRSGGVV